jgi:6-phosphogluconolactonase
MPFRIGRFPALATLLFILMTAHNSFSADESRFYLSTVTDNTDSQGLYVGTINEDTGKLGPIVLAAEATNPIFSTVSPDGKFLYASMESEDGAVGAFAVKDNGTLQLLNTRPSGGKVACHISMDSTGRHVFVANYSSGNIACFAVHPDGSLGERTAFVQFEGMGPDTGRQKQSYAHGIYTSADDRFVYVCDLGADKVWSFQFDSDQGTLTPTDPPAGVVPPGGGPRHLVFSPDGRLAYANNEMGISTTVFSRDTDTGVLTPLETVSCSPETAGPREGVTTAEICLHPSGKWLYVTNRGDDLIAVHALDSEGRLTLLENIPAETAIPSGMALDPSGKWLVVAGMKGNTLTVFAINPENGRLKSTGQSVEAPAGFGITFVPTP